jgi:hypothetical protein
MLNVSHPFVSGRMWIPEFNANINRNGNEFITDWVSSTRQESPTALAYWFERFSKSGTYRCTHRRMVVWANATLGHHLDQVTGAALKGQIPPDAQDDDFLVKMAP